MAEHNELGVLGEGLAAEHLISNGFTILYRNWHYRKEEIDIIAEKDGVLVFVEVKTRTHDLFDTPASTITMKKQKRLLHAADMFIKEFERTEEGRFDVIFIIHNSAFTKLDHIVDAFYASI